MFNLRKKQLRTGFLPYILVLIAVVSRMVPHAPNFTATGASSVYSGRYFKGITRFAVPLSAMLVTDIFLGLHKTMPFVYLCFGVNILLGVWIAKKPTLVKIVSATLLASTTFFIVTNLGVWLVGDLYPKSAQGLVSCYVNAIPFARNTFLGDLVFVGVLFGITEAINRYQQSTIVIARSGETKQSGFIR